jgi:hypothetical protein
LVENRIQNESNTVNEFGFRDMLRADRTFKFGTDVDDRLTWAHDEWFHQAYGVYSETAVRTHTGTRGVIVEYLWDGDDKIRLRPGQSRLIRRHIFPGKHRLEIIGLGRKLSGASVQPVAFEIRDPNGPVRNAQFVFSDNAGKALGLAQTDNDGLVHFLASNGKYQVDILANGRPDVDFPVEVTDRAGGNQVTLDIQPCGYLQVQMRNFGRSSTDVAAEIDTMEMVHRSEQGQLVMTTGPFLEVTVHIRVQCANWFDINRVQILLNGKLDDRYNYTRREHGERFGLGVVKFDRKIELEVTQDTHIVVATAGEGLQLGPVMRADRGKQVPVAESNPVFVDSDGTGFTANGDRLGVDLPLVSE